MFSREVRTTSFDEAAKPHDTTNARVWWTEETPPVSSSNCLLQFCQGRIKWHLPRTTFPNTPIVRGSGPHVPPSSPDGNDFSGMLSTRQINPREVIAGHQQLIPS